MPAAREKDRAIVVRVPYGSKAAGFDGTSLNDSNKYQANFQYALMGLPDETSSNAYVYPTRTITPEEAKRNNRVLTESPVVYIVVFKISEKMKKKDWLEKAVGDKEGGDFKLYKQSHVVYIGETNNILNRTNQHLHSADRLGGLGGEETYDDVAAEVGERKRADHVIQKAVAANIPVWQYVIWDTFFTKSMTLDMENKFIDYSHALDDVYTLNGRGNAQRSYYKSEEKDMVCSRIWQTLSLDDPALFPPEQDIWNSELYKVSPFHALGKEQSLAVNDVCDSALALLDGKPVCGEKLEDTSSLHRLIVVEGASGTGKSIVLSTLFVRLSQALKNCEDEESEYGLQPNNKVCLVVNQDQQLTMYTNLAKKIGLMRTKNDSDACVYKATPFLNAIDSGKREQPDIVLVDEAHLLRMNAHRSYGKGCSTRKDGSLMFHGNQLYDILLRAKVVIAVFDPVQVMRSSQYWEKKLVEEMLPANRPLSGGALTYSGAIEMRSNGNSTPGYDTFNYYHIALTEQFRIDASDNVMEWIDRLADPAAVGMKPIPEDTTPRQFPEGIHGDKPYDLRVYSSPVLLEAAIKRRTAEVEAKICSSSKKNREKRFAAPLCRLLATYDWGYNTKASDGSVVLYKVIGAGGNISWQMPVDGRPPAGFSGNAEDVFSRKWNYSISKNDGKSVWSSDVSADDEVGSYFSVQGFDLNYAGVIIGPSIKYREGHIVVDKTQSKDSEASGDYAEELILQQLKILIRRGIHGLYLFAIDPNLQSVLETEAQLTGRLDILD